MFPTDSVVVTDGRLVSDLIKKRRELGQDRYDEVWEGVYVMSPGPGLPHQRMVGDLYFIFTLTQSSKGAEVYPGLNVSDREDDWTTNFREPDVAVLFPGCKAKSIGSVLVGGPDFVVEILSTDDLARQKLGFYAKVETRECLYIDLATHATELYRLTGNQMSLVGKSTIDSPIVLSSEVLDLSFQAVTEQNDAKVLITNLKNPSQKWFA